MPSLSMQLNFDAVRAKPGLCRLANREPVSLTDVPRGLIHVWVLVR